MSRSLPSAPLEQDARPVWDRFVRVFHWTLVGCVLTNGLLMDDGEDWHRWLGYLAGALVLARVVWGFVGSRHARFADFWPTPAPLLAPLPQAPAQQGDATADDGGPGGVARVVGAAQGLGAARHQHRQ